MARKKMKSQNAGGWATRRARQAASDGGGSVDKPAAATYYDARLHSVTQVHAAVMLADLGVRLHLPIDAWRRYVLRTGLGMEDDEVNTILAQGGILGTPAPASDAARKACMDYAPAEEGCAFGDDDDEAPTAAAAIVGRDALTESIREREKVMEAHDPIPGCRHLRQER
jgi:hypothetical protein